MCSRREALSATTIYALKSSTVSARKIILNSDTSETLKNCCHVGFEPETSDAGLEKIPDFFKKSGANLHPWVAITPIEGNDIACFFGKGCFSLIVCRKKVNILDRKIARRRAGTTAGVTAQSSRMAVSRTG